MGESDNSALYVSTHSLLSSRYVTFHSAGGKFLTGVTGGEGAEV